MSHLLRAVPLAAAVLCGFAALADPLPPDATYRPLPTQRGVPVSAVRVALPSEARQFLQLSRLADAVELPEPPDVRVARELGSLLRPGDRRCDPNKAEGGDHGTFADAPSSDRDRNGRDHGDERREHKERRKRRIGVVVAGEDPERRSDPGMDDD